MFIRHSKKVIGILKELSIGTDADSCIKKIRCGRKARQYIQAHYDGTSEGACHK